MDVVARLGSRTPRIALRTVVLSGLSAFGLVATYLVAVRTVRGQYLDLVAMRGQQVEPETMVKSAGTLLGTISIASALGVLALVVVAGVVRNRWRVGMVVAGIMVGAVATTEALKHVILTRPLLVALSSSDVPVNTLPSGHSTTAMSVTVALILMSPKRFQFAAALVGAPYAVGIGIATVIAHWHRPSDVVAAWFVVAAWTFLGIAMLRLSGSVEPDQPASWGRLIGPGLAGLLILAIAILMVTTVIGLTARLPAVPVGEQRTVFKSAFAFGFSLASIAGVAATFLGTLLWVLRDSVLSDPV